MGTQRQIKLKSAFVFLVLGFGLQSCNRRADDEGSTVIRAKAGVHSTFSDLISKPIRTDRKIVLKPPTQADALARATSITPKTITALPHKKTAIAYRFNSRVFNRPAHSRKTIGIFRRGSYLYVEKEVSGGGCAKGRWYQALPKGYVCTSDGVKIENGVPDDLPSLRPPDISGALPFRYAYVKNRGAPLLNEIPTQAEHERILDARETGHAWPKVAGTRMNGDYFVAMDKTVTKAWGTFWKRIRGKYVYESDLKMKRLPPMVGIDLSSKISLPIAFINVDETPVYRIADGGLSQIGSAFKHARVMVENIVQEDDVAFVQTPKKLAVRKTDVRLVKPLPRPDRVPENHKWIHIDLSEQTLVAYESDTPVFATLVSSGKPGHDTVLGTFQVRNKYITHTMDGRDPKDGYFDVAEVPWVMYFFKSYAMHGAYWHNTFGTTRSHGCVNLSPADAKWLFYWTSPSLPPNWLAVRMAEGTYVHITP